MDWLTWMTVLKLGILIVVAAISFGIAFTDPK